VGLVNIAAGLVNIAAGLVPGAVLGREGFRREIKQKRLLTPFRSKNEAKLAPGSGLSYSGNVYIGTDDLDTIC
jgi:hypothetical protein